MSAASRWSAWWLSSQAGSWVCLGHAGSEWEAWGLADGLPADAEICVSQESARELVEVAL